MSLQHYTACALDELARAERAAVIAEEDARRFAATYPVPSTPMLQLQHQKISDYYHAALERLEAARLGVAELTGSGAGIFDFMKSIVSHDPRKPNPFRGLTNTVKDVAKRVITNKDAISALASSLAAGSARRRRY